MDERQEVIRESGLSLIIIFLTITTIFTFIKIHNKEPTFKRTFPLYIPT